MQDVEWKPISELPARARNFAVFDPSMALGCQIITGCRILKKQICCPSGVPIKDASYFTKDIKLPGN